MTSVHSEEKILTVYAICERLIAMEQLLSILYCRDVFHDFRKPVEVMYPHLAATYHSAIRRPMELGTLLLKVRKHEVLTIHELRTSLQLVHNNALHFNEGILRCCVLALAKIFPVLYDLYMIVMYCYFRSSTNGSNV